MSIDLRHRLHKDDKITMLDRNIWDNPYPNPLVVPYITENNYYEIKVEGIGISKSKFNTSEYISMMIDSGTTFSHFP